MRLTKAHFENYYKAWDRDLLHPCFENEEEFKRFAYLLKQCRKREFQLKTTLRSGSNNQIIYVNLNTKQIQLDISYNAHTYLASSNLSPSNYSESYESMRSMFMWLKENSGWEGLGKFIGRQTRFFILKREGKLNKKKEKKESIFII